MFDRILLTGDLHGIREDLLRLLRAYRLGERDLLLVTGDFGFVMRNTYREEAFLDDLMREFSCTIAFVLGNHEHYPRIYGYPTKPWCGGKARFIRERVIALVNGEVYTIPTAEGDKTVFAMGGAASTDRGFNQNRYATLFYGVSRERISPFLVRRDAYDHQKKMADALVVTDREDCYRLIDAIAAILYRRLGGILKRIFACYDECLTRDRDERRSFFAEMIQKSFGEAYQKEVREALAGYREELFSLFASFGYEGDTVALVLKEGTWFKEELPTGEDYRNATANLKRHGMAVDYIISHTLPREMILRHGITPYPVDAELTGFLEWVMYETDFKHHFGGHFHEDAAVGDKHTLVYREVHIL